MTLALSIAAILHRTRHLRILNTTEDSAVKFAVWTALGEAIRSYFQKATQKRQEPSRLV